jgi:type IV secretion system protein VirD4
MTSLRHPAKHFGVNDTATAELVSARLGEQTIIVESGGSSTGDSYQHSSGAQPQSSYGSSSNKSSNWAQQARKLLKPEEVIALPQRAAITFAPGVPPTCTWLLRYYEERGLGRLPGRFVRWLKSGRILLASALLCGASIGFAALLTHTVLQLAQR